MIRRQIQDLRNKIEIIKAAAVASILSTLISNPIEVLKLNRQFFPLSCHLYPHASYRQLVFCSCMKFSMNGSISSLKVALPQTLVNNIMFMQLYEQIRESLINNQYGSTSATFLSSIIGRFIVTSLSLPFQSLRIRLSNEVVNHKLNFHGYKITMTRDLLFSGLYWSMIQAYRNYETKGQYRQKIIYEEDFTKKNFLVNLLPGLVFASIVAIITTPLDTVKTRVQSQGITKYKIMKSMRDIYRKEGMLGLFSGVQWRAMKSGLHSSIYLFLYEWWLTKISSEDILNKMRQ